MASAPSYDPDTILSPWERTVPGQTAASGNARPDTGRIACTDFTDPDEESRAKLGKLADDIQQMLDREELEASDDEALLSDLVIKFEAEHPQLTSVLNQMPTALTNLGIRASGAVVEYRSHIVTVIDFT